MYHESAVGKFNLVSWVLVILLGISVTGNVVLKRIIQEEMRVTHVVDGDSFFLKNGALVRLAGADAPELAGCLGKEAYEKLRTLVEGKIVRLTHRDNDMYGRVLAQVYVGNVAVDSEMLRFGLARLHYQNNGENEGLKIAAREAQDQNRGVYDVCTRKTQETDAKECKVKGNIDDSTKKKYYHLPGCPHYKLVVLSLDIGERCFETEKEAIAAGFSKATDCK